MFDNIGGKIKRLAVVLCIIGIVISVIIGSTMMQSEYLTTPGILVILAGFALAWISSFFTYGFGELIEKVGKIESALNSPGTIPAVSKPNTTAFVSGAAKPHTAPPVYQPSSVKKCDLCNKGNVILYSAKLVDEYGGIRYRKVCDECYKKYNCQPDDKE